MAFDVGTKGDIMRYQNNGHQLLKTQASYGSTSPTFALRNPGRDMWPMSKKQRKLLFGTPVHEQSCLFQDILRQEDDEKFAWE